MATAPRFWTGNHIFNGAGLVESSQEDTLPVEALYDQQRTYKWRTMTGWTITTQNNYIDFVRSGTKTAVITPGYYATGTAMAAAIVTAMEAADSTPVWECDYGVAAANTFRIRNTGAALNFDLLFLTGVNAYRSIHRSLGFSNVDLTGNTTYTAGSVSYQSQHFLVITLTAAQATEGVTAIGMFDHNYNGEQPACVLQVQSNATNDWSAPTIQANSTFGSASVVLGASPQGRKYISESNHTYWRVKVDDVSNPVGYFELPILWLGNYITSPHCFSVSQSRKPRDFSSVMSAIPGQHSAVYRNRRKELSLEVAEVLDATAESTLREFFEDIHSGENFILDLDPSAADSQPWTKILYGFMPDTESESFVPTDYWTFQFPFCEAL